MNYKDYTLEDFVIIEKENKVLRGKESFYLKLKYNKGKVIFPEGIREISPFAFNEKKEITEVIFPKSLREIESCAFKDCNISKVVFKEGITYIGTNSFEKSNLT